MTDIIIKSILMDRLCLLASRYFFPPLISFITAKNSYSRKSVKPFECAYCLSWWSALCYFLFVGEAWAIPAAAFCAIVAAQIDEKL